MPEDKQKIYNTFLQWYAMPESVREPKTIPEFCVHMGVTEQDIALFRQEEDFTDDLVRHALEWGKTKFPELLGIIYDAARTSKNVNHIKSFADLINSNDKRELADLKKDTKKKEASSLRDLFAHD